MAPLLEVVGEPADGLWTRGGAGWRADGLQPEIGIVNADEAK